MSNKRYPEEFRSEAVKRAMECGHPLAESPSCSPACGSKKAAPIVFKT